MQALISFFIFVFVLFLYVHVTSVWKRSEDLEIYEVDYTTHKALQDVVAIKQPVLFQLEPHHPHFFAKMNLSKMKKYDNYDVNVKDLADYKKEDSVYPVSLPMRTATTLMATDTHARFISEDNAKYLEESGFDAVCHSLDTYLKPSFTVSRNYDIMYGSKHACTPLRYHLDSQHYIVVNEGKIRVKMAPWKFGKVLDPIADYETYEFRSLLNPWKPEERKKEYEKIRFVEFEVYAGSVLFIPAYWWYSLCFSGEMLNSLTIVKYNTGASVLANLNHLGKYVLQQSNTKTKVAKTLPVSLDGGNISTATADITSAAEGDNIEQDTHTPVLFEGKKSANTEIVSNAGIYKTTGDMGESTYVDGIMTKKSVAESR
jgi:hypothetical protein